MNIRTAIAPASSAMEQTEQSGVAAMHREQLLQVTVHAKRRETTNIVSLDLRRPDGAPLPAFTAGAHLDIHLPAGIVRQYSLCNDPKERDRYLIAVLRESDSRGGSSALHDKVQQGDVLSIGEPRNHFSLIENASPALLIAGGIGVTPLLAMAERLCDLKSDFSLHYCSRSQEHMPFRDRLANSRYAARVRLHFDTGPESQRLDADVLLSRPSADAQLYVCGPAGFIDYIITRARSHDWPAPQLHREYFAADADPLRGGDSFRIKLISTGQILDVPENKTVVDVLADAGVAVPMSCEQGVCGTCMTGVLAGDLDHRDLYLTAKERAAGRHFLPCCSRGSGLVVLDL